jgi:hypothetical protein
MQEEIGGVAIRMEEEEEGGRGGEVVGFAPPKSTPDAQKTAENFKLSEAHQQFIRSLSMQRERIQNDEKLSARTKLRLLEENRKALASPRVERPEAPRMSSMEF